jgi:hypothetical protein
MDKKNKNASFILDINQSLIEHEYRLMVLEYILDWIVSENESTIKLPTRAELDFIRRDIVKTLEKKYPQLGIRFKEEVLENGK